MDSIRYERQKGIQGWDQTLLQKARVLVAGAGALGNELIKNLALLGIGKILVVDFDRIEISNLSRSVLFRDADVGYPKASTAVNAARRLNPDIDLRAIDGNLFHDLGLGFYRHSDIVVGCLDNLAARSRVGLSSVLAGVPFLDGGMWALGGEVRWFMAGEGPCFDCTLNADSRQRIFERLSCTGFSRDGNESNDQPQATTAFTASIIGGLLAQETVRYLSGLNVDAGEAVVYNGLKIAMHRSTLPRSLECLNHDPYREVNELESGVNQTTAGQLLRRAETELGSPPILELGRDFLLGFICDNCRTTEDVDSLLAQIAEARITCPRCGKTRKPQILSRVDGRSSYLDRTLAQLGVPPGEVLAARSERGLRLYELTGDLEQFWF
ncbi:MAG TPA: ThiF family adenylyltransferase [Pyrinomonadaceae bacterium]|nr:ThiF family adenylyltransferase [Pyrinomonadaceae bacterium]